MIIDLIKKIFNRKFFDLNNRLFSVLVGLVVAGIFCSGMYAFAAYTYNPGDILDPIGCTGPDDANCIAPPATYSFASNNFLGTGNFSTTGTGTFGVVNASSGLCINGDCRYAWPAAGTGSSQWLDNGSAIYYTAGNVGIGTTNPADKLEVSGNINIINGGSYMSGGNILISFPTDTVQFGSLGDFSNVALGGLFGINVTNLGSHLIGIGDYTQDMYTTRILLDADADLITFDAGTATFSGRVGIGNTNPSVPLEVTGDIKSTQPHSYLQIKENAYPLSGGGGTLYVSGIEPNINSLPALSGDRILGTDGTFAVVNTDLATSSYGPNLLTVTNYNSTAKTFQSVSLGVAKNNTGDWYGFIDQPLEIINTNNNSYYPITAGFGSSFTNGTTTFSIDDYTLTNTTLTGATVPVLSSDLKLVGVDKMLSIYARTSGQFPMMIMGSVDSSDLYTQIYNPTANAVGISSANASGSSAPFSSYTVNADAFYLSGQICLDGDCISDWSDIASTGTSQWLNNSSDIYFSAGNVGIGTTNNGSASLQVAAAPGGSCDDSSCVTKTSCEASPVECNGGTWTAAACSGNYVIDGTCTGWYDDGSGTCSGDEGCGNYLNGSDCTTNGCSWTPNYSGDCSMLDSGGCAGYPGQCTWSGSSGSCVGLNAETCESYGAYGCTGWVEGSCSDSSCSTEASCTGSVKKCDSTWSAGGYSDYAINATGNITASNFVLPASGALKYDDGKILAYGNTDKDNYLFGNAGNLTMTGQYNTAVGSYSFIVNTVGEGNSALGYLALSSNLIGSYNVALGFAALQFNTSGGHNSAVGDYALQNNDSGNGNSALGSYALFHNISGNNNSAIGWYALNTNSTGTNNTAIGSQAMQGSTTGSGNTAIGSASLFYNTVGNFNTALGTESLMRNASGSYNIGIGYDSLYSNANGDNNIGIGRLTLMYSQGSNNVAIGNYALNAVGSLGATGSNNVALGYMAGTYETGDNTFYVNNKDRTNLSGDRTQSLIYGIFATAAASQSFTMNAGNIYMPYLNAGSAGTVKADTSGKLWVDSSSLRFKDNVLPLAENWITILQVQPKSFTYKPTGEREIGYIAEDFDALGLNDLVGYDKEGRPTSINYDRITLYNTEILKQQQIEINALKEKLGIAIDVTTITPAGTAGDGTVSGVTITGFDQTVQASLANLGVTLSSGVMSLKQIIADNATVKTATIGQINIQKMQMVDQATGDVYCTWIENGEWKKTKGDCATAKEDSTSSSSLTTTSDNTSDSTPQQIDQAPTDNLVVDNTPVMPVIPNISSLASISAINVAYGTELALANLPTTVDATLSDNSTQSLTITWDNGSPSYDPNTAGTYVFSGTLTLPENVTNTNNLNATAKIIVEKQPALTKDTLSTAVDIIENTTSSLLNGVLNFIKNIINSASKVALYIPNIKTITASLLQAIKK